jgi:Common central domain of tyrosinase/Polyphenol oxidase middle domain
LGVSIADLLISIHRTLGLGDAGCKPAIRGGHIMKNNFSRRRFLATVGATAGVSLAGKSLFNVAKVFAVGPYVRPNVSGLTLTSPEIASYIAGVTAMKALPATNPNSWTYQAAIHGTTAAPMLAQNTCQHGSGTNFFWSWHRMYLYWFERIVRKQSGSSTWALPFWNWQTNLTLPSMFQTPPTGSSVLYVSSRTASMNNGTGSLSNLTSGVNSAYAQPIFEGASGADSLIQNPHNSVHVQVGGLMGSITTAAEDPLFFLHHANCDRLWDLWLTQGGGQSDPTTDTVWENQVFTFFDENGAQQQMTSCDVLRAALQLNYSYQGEPPQVNQYCGTPPLCTGTSTVVINQCIPNPPCLLPPGPGPVYFEFTVSSQLAQQIIAYAQNDADTLYLQFGGVTAPTQPGVVWDVYVGLPVGGMPNPTSPYYVGTIGMYGPGIADQPPDGNEPATYNLPINTAVLTALQAGELTVPVTFVPHGVMVGGQLTLPKQLSTMSIAQSQLSVQTVSQ